MKPLLCFLFATVIWQRFGENVANVVPPAQNPTTSSPAISKESVIKAANTISDFWENTGKNIASANVQPNSSYAALVENANKVSAGWQSFGKNILVGAGGLPQAPQAAAPPAQTSPPSGSSSFLDSINKFSNTAQNLGNAADGLGKLGNFFKKSKK